MLSSCLIKLSASTSPANCCWDKSLIGDVYKRQIILLQIVVDTASVIVVPLITGLYIQGHLQIRLSVSLHVTLFVYTVDFQIVIILFGICSHFSKVGCRLIILIQMEIGQIDFCKYELKGGSCRIFKDKGYSGKNTDRPEFQKLLGEIRKGKVRRVVVYKLDRISRSILDFANMMELFQEYDVEFVSSTEKFDTSTPMGRAMLNICIVFAQLERETIQKNRAFLLSDTPHLRYGSRGEEGRFAHR